MDHQFAEIIDSERSLITWSMNHGGPNLEDNDLDQLKELGERRMLQIPRAEETQGAAEPISMIELARVIRSIKKGKHQDRMERKVIYSNIWRRT